MADAKTADAAALKSALTVTTLGRVIHVYVAVHGSYGLQCGTSAAATRMDVATP